MSSSTARFFNCEIRETRRTSSIVISIDQAHVPAYGRAGSMLTSDPILVKMRPREEWTTDSQVGRTEFGLVFALKLSLNYLLSESELKRSEWNSKRKTFRATKILRRVSRDADNICRFTPRARNADLFAQRNAVMVLIFTEREREREREEG